MSEPLRLAVLVIPLDVLGEATIQDPGLGHWDEDSWVEPERRYQLTAFLALFPLPHDWQLATVPFHHTVWMEYETGSLQVLLTGPDFPPATFGARPPRIEPIYERDLVNRRWVLRDYNVRELQH